MTEKTRTLIVTGDDFGFSPSINAAVIRAHREGILTSASLMVNGPAFEEAVGMARAHPELSVGIHISLVRSRSTLPTAAAPDLVDGDGNLPENPVTAGIRFFFSARLKRQLEGEIRAKIKKSLPTGLPPAYIDGHLHLHVHPTVLDILLDLASTYSIPAFRLPRESLAINLRLDRKRRPEKTFHALVYGRLCAHAEKGMRQRGFFYPDRFFGLLACGRLDESYLIGVLETLAPGVTEIGMHPALALPPGLERWAPDYDYEGEFRALISPKVRETLQRLGIRLAGYRAAAANGSPPSLRL